MAETVTEFNVGRWCMSEDECIAAGINFAAYERGVIDAANAFARNRPASVVRTDPAQPWTPEHCRNYPTEAAALLNARGVGIPRKEQP
jgi:hypothetical protein